MDSETVEVTSSQPLIDIRGGDDFDCALYVEGRAVAMNWHDCMGSICQYLIRRDASDADRKLKALNHVLNDGQLREDTPISSQVWPLLELLAPGKYRLCLLSGCKDCGLLRYNTNWRTDFAKEEFYPYGHDLVFTQPADKLDPVRVAHYQRRIQTGVRPVAVTITIVEGLAEYIIDGHHKLTAYETAGVGPTLLQITRLDPPPLPITTIDDFATKHPLAKHYRKNKKEAQEFMQRSMSSTRPAKGVWARMFRRFTGRG